MNCNDEMKCTIGCDDAPFSCFRNHNRKSDCRFPSFYCYIGNYNTVEDWRGGISGCTHEENHFFRH